MKVNIKASDLKAALDVAGKAVGADSTRPIVGCVLIEAHVDGGLTVTGNDGRVRASKTAAAMVEAPGAVALPPKAVVELLDAIGGDAVVALAVNASHRATFTSGVTTKRLGGFDAQDFPAAPSTDDLKTELYLDPTALRDLIGGVAFAADRDKDARPERQCVHLRTRGGALIAEATDGLRVARRSMPLDDAPDLDLLVPAGALAKAVANVTAGTTSARLRVVGGGMDTPTHLLLDHPEAETAAGDWAITLIGGTFPDVDRIIPPESPIGVVVDRALLKRALKVVRGVERVAVGYRVDLAISPSPEAQGSSSCDGTLTLSASDRSSDHEAQTEIPIELHGDPVPLALTAPHLDDVLDALDRYALVEMSIRSRRHPILVIGHGDDEREHAHVLMPIVSEA